MTSFARITPEIISGNVNAVRDFFKVDLKGDKNAVDVCGDTLLHIAARHNSTESVREIEVLLICDCKIEFNRPNSVGVCARDMRDQMAEGNVSNNDRYHEIFRDCLELICIDPGPPEKLKVNKI